MKIVIFLYLSICISLHSSEKNLLIETDNYKIKKGDSLAKIALSNDVSVSYLLTLNRLINPNRIRINQIIKVPNTAARELIVANSLKMKALVDNLGSNKYELINESISELLKQDWRAVHILKNALSSNDLNISRKVKYILRKGHESRRKYNKLGFDDFFDNFSDIQAQEKITGLTNAGVSLTNGDAIYGYVKQIDDQFLFLKTEYGDLKIKKEFILSITLKRSDKQAPFIERSFTESRDFYLLENGDFVEGELIAMRNKTAFIRTTLGEQGIPIEKFIFIAPNPKKLLIPNQSDSDLTFSHENGRITLQSNFEKGSLNVNSSTIEGINSYLNSYHDKSLPFIYSKSSR